MAQEFSKERRDFLGKSMDLLMGAGAFVACTLHGGLLTALELPKGTKWAEGMRRLRDATKETNENIVIFVGSGDDRECVTAREGVARTVDISSSAMAESIVADGKPELIKKGVYVDHTHTDVDILKDFNDVMGRAASPASRGDVWRILSGPSNKDMTIAAQPTIEKYLEMAGVATKALEWGVMTSRGRWAMRKIIWTDALKRRYKEAYGFHRERSEQYARSHAFAKRWLNARPEIVREISDASMIEWKRIATTDEARADVLAHLWLVRDIDIKPEHMARLKAQPGIVDMLRQLGEYWRLTNDALREFLMMDLTERVRDREIPLPVAMREYRAIARDAGLELLYTPHS